MVPVSSAQIAVLKADLILTLWLVLPGLTLSLAVPDTCSAEGRPDWVPHLRLCPPLCVGLHTHPGTGGHALRWAAKSLCLQVATVLPTGCIWVLQQHWGWRARPQVGVKGLLASCGSAGQLFIGCCRSVLGLEGTPSGGCPAELSLLARLTTYNWGSAGQLIVACRLQPLLGAGGHALGWVWKGCLLASCKRAGGWVSS